MKVYEIGTGYTPIPAQVPAATESIVEELSRALLRSGHAVEILDISAENRMPTDLPLREVAVPALFSRPDVKLGLVHKTKRVVYSAALAMELKKILKREQQKVVLHFHNQYNMFFYLMLVPKSLRRRAWAVYTNHNGYWSLPWEQAKARIYRRYFQEIAAMRQADQVFTLNAQMRRNIEENLGIPKEKLRLIANGVNLEVYRPLPEHPVEEIKKELGLAGKRVILQVGSVNENKGQIRCLRQLSSAMKADENLVFAYAGGIVSREYHQALEQEAQALGLREQVVYLGTAQPGAEMNRLYNVAAATICASRYEGFGLVWLESLAAGVPVLLCSDTVQSLGAGCLQFSPETFDRDLQAFLAGNAEVKAAARANACANFSWEKIGGEYAQAMKQGLRI